jgi:sugar-phosphatase
VLIDTGAVYDRHWAAWAMERGLDPALIVGLHHGRPALLTIQLMAPELDAAAEADRFNAGISADEGAEGVVALPGAVAMAATLPPERWAICTSAPRILAERWLDGIGIPRPAAMVTVEDVARGKPSPDPYLRAAELIGRDPARCLAVEDAPNGITAAKAAGAPVLAVATTFEPVHLGAADHIVGGLDELTFAIDGDDIVISWEG